MSNEIRVQKGFKPTPLYTVSLANGSRYEVTQIHQNGANVVTNNNDGTEQVASTPSAALRHIRYAARIKDVQPINNGWFTENDRYERSIGWR